MNGFGKAGLLGVVGLLLYSCGQAPQAPTTTGNSNANVEAQMLPRGTTITVATSAATQKAVSYDWTLHKTAGVINGPLKPGDSATVTYMLEATRGAPSTNYTATGKVCVTNTGAFAATNLNVAAALIKTVSGSDSVVTSKALLSGGSLAAGATACWNYSIPFDAEPGATFRVSGSASISNFRLTSTTIGPKTVTDVKALDLASATLTSETDETALINDSLNCPAGFTCDVSELPNGTVLTGTQTLTYNVKVTNVDAQCGSAYELLNTATLTEQDTSTVRTSYGDVDVQTAPCNVITGCTRTQGYWRTHSNSGPAPYDATWATIGENTLFFSSGKSYITVINTPSREGNAYYILGRQYIAALLNQASGASVPSDVAQAMTDARTFFMTYAPEPQSAFGPVRNNLITLADILDTYNNGNNPNGPRHCDYK